MSKAFKCDRCKNYYDPYVGQDFSLYGHIEKVDLCPACQDKLTKWAKEYEFFECVNEEETAKRTEMPEIEAAEPVPGEIGYEEAAGE